MNPPALNADDRAAALDRLLLSYAMAVDRMRHLQCSKAPFEPMTRSAERDSAEREVDEMTALFLTPRPS